MSSPNESSESRTHSIVAARRISQLSLHLIKPSAPQLRPHLCAAAPVMVEGLDQGLLAYMRGKHRDLQEKVFEYFVARRPELRTPIEISMRDHRELCMKQLSGLVREAGVRPFRYLFEDPEKYFSVLEAVGSVDMSLGIKLGVQY
ncbi:hypothetical protein Droror1_Dr00028011, partial [Drosera rotundifolia]